MSGDRQSRGHGTQRVDYIFGVDGEFFDAPRHNGFDVWNLVDQNGKQGQPRQPDENVSNSFGHAASIARVYERELRGWGRFNDEMRIFVLTLPSLTIIMKIYETDS